MSTDTAHTGKETNGNFDIPPGTDHYDAINRVRTAGSISISPEMFEKLYLSPENRVKGDLRKTFGNPTPLALIGFLLSLFPLSMELMGWRGTGGTGVGAAQTGAYFFCGGLLMIIGAIGEWILGNTFPFVVFGSFGGFWLTFGATLQPFYNATGAYAADPTDFYASFAFFFVAMGLLCLVYLIASVRTNIMFVIIFATLVVAFGLLAGAYWQAAGGNLALSGKLQIAAGAFVFITCASGWWIFLAIVLASVDFPFALPVGDLSTFIHGAADRAKTKVNGSKV